MKISIYGHSGSFNHGNEAIVRGLCKLFKNESLTLYSFVPDIDTKFGLDKVCEIKPFFNTYKRYSIIHIFLALWSRITKSRKLYYKYYLRDFFKNIEGIYLLEAGDQYCENDLLRNFYAYLNREITKKGGKTVMLGCTINKEFLKNKEVIIDLNQYSLIIARESITYNALINAGITKNTKLAPDPAFLMDNDICNLPMIFNNQDVVGINVGFLAQNNEIYYDLIVKNCTTLIEHIINNTKYNVALIPHVNWNYKLSDLRTLEFLYEKFKDSDRIQIVSEHNALQQKYIMSKCRFMIALRTHASISSIASQVPTLVTGYKIKSTGIVRDIFPENMKLLAHVQSLTTETDFVNNFIWMQENEALIRKYMKKEIPTYIDKTDIIYKEIQKLKKEV